MKFPIFHNLPEKQGKLQTIADKIMIKTIITALTTSKGWIIRQALKVTGGAFASFAIATHAKAEALGVSPELVNSTLTPLDAALSALVVLGVEVGLSFLARKNQ